MTKASLDKHPARVFPNKFLFHDWSDHPENIQIIDLLHDIRLLLLLVVFLLILA